MATYTNHYGLIRFTFSESLATNDYQFTSRNLDVIDQVLHKLESEVFTGSAAIGTPGPPTLLLSSVGGNIPSGRTVRYKITWVDGFGAESAASVESVISTPGPVSSPGAPSLSVVTTGGTLKPGNYFYALSAYVSADTNETRVGTQAYLAASVGTSTNTFTLTLPSTPAGADGFNIFRRGPGETQFYWLESIATNVATPPSTYVDTGSVLPSNTRQPIARNLTNSTNQIAVTVPGATPTVPAGYTWKIYRTMEVGNYNQSFLKWVVEETSQGSGIVEPDYDDIGLTPNSGVPPTESQITASTSRLNALELLLPHGPIVKFQVGDMAIYTETLFQITALNLSPQGGRMYSFDGMLMYSVEASENMKFVVACANSSVQIKFVTNPGPGDGTVNLKDTVVRNAGDSSATPGIPDPVGVSISGTVDLYDVASSVYPTITISAAKITEAATPLTPLVIKRGSWLRLI